MQRDVEKSLLSWKNRANRKPLVLMGARQVGKTWLMREFGKRNFARVHEFNFDEQKGLAGFFRDTKEPKDILPKLAALSGARIDVDADVVVFDEIQECRKVPAARDPSGGKPAGRPAREKTARRGRGVRGCRCGLRAVLSGRTG